MRFSVGASLDVDFDVGIHSNIFDEFDCSLEAMNSKNRVVNDRII